MSKCWIRLWKMRLNNLDVEVCARGFSKQRAQTKGQNQTNQRLWSYTLTRRTEWKTSLSNQSKLILRRQGAFQFHTRQSQRLLSWRSSRQILWKFKFMRARRTKCTSMRSWGIKGSLVAARTSLKWRCFSTKSFRGRWRRVGGTQLHRQNSTTKDRRWQILRQM